VTSPVWIDGPLKGHEHEIPPEAVDDGMYRYTPADIYTFTRVGVFGREVVVASTKTGLLDLETLARELLTSAAYKASQ
jgi:hypothetical protein